MKIKIAFLTTIILMSVSTLQVQAAEINLGKDLTIGTNTAAQDSSVKSSMDKLAEPYNDIELSDEVSAGVITGRDELTMEKNNGLPVDEKGPEVGVGISLSF